MIDYFLYLLNLLKLIGYEIDFKKNNSFKFLNLRTLQFDHNYSNKSIVFPHDLLNKSKKVNYESVDSFFKIFEQFLQNHHLNNMNLHIPTNYLKFKKIILEFFIKKMKNIIKDNIDEILKSRYLSYAVSTIISRSLPDLRDGLKPVHRRIIYSMYLLKLYNNSPFKKSARIVGDVMGKFHPHGDQAIYQSLVRMAQDFSSRVTLIEGQGNFGNIDGDNAAAMRYTEARLEEITELFFDGIEEDSTTFSDNYDGQNLEPDVLPSKLPNILLNGSTGIAVGMATNIPPHNLIELNDCIIKLIKKPNTTDSELLKILKVLICQLVVK